MAARTTYHVVPHPSGWQVKLSRAGRASGVYATKAKALAAARALATNSPRSQVVIHQSNGTIVADRTYEPARYLRKRKRRKAAKKAVKTKKRKKAKKRKAARQGAATRKRKVQRLHRKRRAAALKAAATRRRRA